MPESPCRSSEVGDSLDHPAVSALDIASKYPDPGPARLNNNKVKLK